MTRQAWESTADGELGFRSSAGGFLSSLSWWLLGLIVLGALTAGTAYYLPLSGRIGRCPSGTPRCKSARTYRIPSCAV